MSEGQEGKRQQELPNGIVLDEEGKPYVYKPLAISIDADLTNDAKIDAVSAHQPHHGKI